MKNWKFAVLLLLAAAPALAQEPPKLNTNQKYIEELYRHAKAPVGDDDCRRIRRSLGQSSRPDCLNAAR